MRRMMNIVNMMMRMMSIIKIMLKITMKFADLSKPWFKPLVSPTLLPPPLPPAGQSSFGQSSEYSDLIIFEVSFSQMPQSHSTAPLSSIQDLYYRLDLTMNIFSHTHTTQASSSCS